MSIIWAVIYFMNDAGAKDQGKDNGDFHHKIIMDSSPFGILITNGNSTNILNFN